MNKQNPGPARELSLSDPVLGDEEVAALREVVESGWITMGEQVYSFEREFARLHDAEHAIAVASGTAALHLALLGLDIGPGDEVLVPSLTFVASANAVWYTGAVPVLTDIESTTVPHMSLSDAESRIASNTKAILLVHYGGWLCDMESWRQLARERNLYIVEDAAHTPGLVAEAEPGTVAAYSFYGNKNMTTAEGGMIVTGDPELADRIRRLRSHGMTTLTLDRYQGHAFSYDVEDLGYNYRMDELRAALGRVQMRRLPESNRRRVELLDAYREAFRDHGSDVHVPFNDDARTTAHICPVVLPGWADREQVMRGLRDAGVHSSVHYPPIHRFSYYLNRIGKRTLPVTEEFCAREVSLPLHPGMNENDVKFIVKNLVSILARQ